MATELPVQTGDGRTLSVHDSGAHPQDRLTVVWHHGSPQTGALLAPLVALAAERGVRLVSYARPSYGGSTPRPGRDVASAAEDVRAVADALGLESVAVMGASGGGPHALACAALLPGRVTAVATLAGVAPFTDAFDWYAGMVQDGALRAAARGREERARFTEDFDSEIFNAADWAALEGPWSSLGADVARAGEAGDDGLVDDDVAFASDWGFEVAEVAAPVLLVHGGDDRVVPAAHSQWLVGVLPRAELWFRPRDGHVGVLDACPVAMDWLLHQAGR